MEEDRASNQDSSQVTDVKRPKSETKRYSEIFREFDNLDLSFIPSAEEDLLADTDSLSLSESIIGSEPREPDESYEDLISQVSDLIPPVSDTDGCLTAQDADLALCHCQNGVETALQYAKMWCRYAKDLLAWMEKRINLEQEFVKNVMKTSEGAKATIMSQDMMPLLHIYTMALEQDIKNSLTLRKTTELLHNRCYQALAAKKNEIDKWRREFKDQWSREQKKMNDAVTAFKKARHQYFQRCEELEKFKAISAKAVDDSLGIKTLDKRRKSKDEAQVKMSEAELLYRQCITDARSHQEELVKVKERIISHTRKLICQGDTVLKEATVNMFYYQRQQTEPVPLSYYNLEVTCRALEPGEQYLQYILSKPRHQQPLQVFNFQEYIPQGKGNKRRTSSGIGYLQDSSPLTSDGRKTGYSDSDSFSGSLESLSSPAHVNKRMPKSASMLTVSSDDLDERDMAELDYADSPTVKTPTLSRAALTHRLRKMKSKMGKCKHCEVYIVVSGVECEECGMALHRKCMELCQLECEHRKGTVFGVDMSLLINNTSEQVPFVVQLCTSEIESRALSVQGVYRVSGSKPRIQKLCQAFEIQKEQVDLSEHSPHDITSILKHFFKELPEPLLTFDLYNDFIAVGKTMQHLREREPTPDTNVIMNIISDLQKLLQKLPSYCYSTLQHLMLHLQKVSENHENKMSPSNLGIVFGPTLLRPLVSTDMSMIALLETGYQAELVEFLITHHAVVFGLQERPSTPPPPVPTAPLPDTPPRASCPLESNVCHQSPERENSFKERPRSLESQTFKRESSEGYISDKSSSNEAVDQLSPEPSERAVLAVRREPRILQDDPDSELVIRPRYCFHRKPVRYHGHPALGTPIPNPGCATEQPAAAVTGTPGSAESSRSSSPDPGIPRQNKMEAQGHPCEVPQFTMGLDSTGTLSGRTKTSSQKDAAGDQAHLNTNMSNNKQRSGHCHSPKTHLTSPAQKILSGLKLRRRHSGKEEQLFV